MEKDTFWKEPAEKELEKKILAAYSRDEEQKRNRSIVMAKNIGPCLPPWCGSATKYRTLLLRPTVFWTGRGSCWESFKSLS